MTRLAFPCRPRSPSRRATSVSFASAIPTSLRVDAFDFTEHGYAEGRVKWISEGAFTVKDDTDQPTILTIASASPLTPYQFFKVPENFRLMPGMTLTADIKVGTRSAGVYLLEGHRRRVSDAMREP